MTRFGSRPVLLVALVAAIIGGVATYGVSALTSTATTEVRISAQRLDDGRVEFALQPRADDGSWGERLLPDRRMFPAEGFLNRWANSSSLEIDSGIPFYVNTTQPSRTVTVEEYLAGCGAEEITDHSFFDEADLARLRQLRVPEGEDATWGTLFAVFDLFLTAVKAIEPPAELAEYQAAQVSIWTIAAQYAFAQPPEEAFDVWSLLPIGLIALGPSQQAEESLDPDLRQRLVDAGCIINEISDADSEIGSSGANEQGSGE